MLILEIHYFDTITPGKGFKCSRLSSSVLVDVYIPLRDRGRDTLGVNPFFHRLDDIEVNPPVIGTLYPTGDLASHDEDDHCGNNLEPIKGNPLLNLDPQILPMQPPLSTGN